MTSATARLLVFVCGICFQMNDCLTSDAAAESEIQSQQKSSWLDAFNQPPSPSYQLMSPYTALEMIQELRNRTSGPVYVNGYSYGEPGEKIGIIIQAANITHLTTVLICNNGSNYESDEGSFTYSEGRAQCQLKGLPFFLTKDTLFLYDQPFWSFDVWAEDTNVTQLFKDNETIRCMVLDLEAGQLMLEECTESHVAVYIQDSYKQTFKKYKDNSTYPFYNPNGRGSTQTGSEVTPASPVSTDNNPVHPSTNQDGAVRTSYNPGTKIPNITTPSSKRKEVLGMNPDIFFTLVGVGSVVVVFTLLFVCCCLRRRKRHSRGRPALSDDYSNPVDSIGMKDDDLNSNPNNGVYASPQDSITPVKAVKRDSIGEGVYDVTFTPGPRKQSEGPNTQPMNAYAHVTIQPGGGAVPLDDTENHYDSASFNKPKQTVLISPTHSDHTYGEVQIKTET